MTGRSSSRTQMVTNNEQTHAPTCTRTDSHSTLSLFRVPRFPRGGGGGRYRG